ncbi:MAG TPA: FapA family protein [Patescibacteria group bacterium]|nr:FapA family protein [Patescibacteria group bacterium]
MANKARPEFTAEEILDFLLLLPADSGNSRTITVKADAHRETIILEESSVISNDVNNQKIKAKGNAVFLGRVTNSSILVAGKAEFQGECQNSYIHASNDIVIRSGTFCDIFSEENIEIGVELHNCIVNAGHQILAENAIVYGGNITAMTLIRLCRAYKPNDYTNLTLSLYDKMQISAKQRLLDKKIQLDEKIIEAIKLKLQITVKRLISENKLQPNNPEIEQLQRQRTEMEKRLFEHRALLEKLRSPVEFDFTKRIEITGKINALAAIEIGALRYTTPSALEKIAFYRKNQKIETVQL